MRAKAIAVLLILALSSCASRDRMAAGHIGLLGVGFIHLRLTNNATRLEDVKLFGVVSGNLYRGIVSVTVTNGVTNRVIIPPGTLPP